MKKDKDKKKLSKNQIRLIRFCVCLAAFIVLYAVGKTVGMPWYVGLATYLVVYFAIGYDVLYRAARNIVHGQVFDENFLMCVATVGAFATGEYPEAAAVMLFYQLGELFQDYAVGKSRKSIASLMDIRPDKAVIFKDGQETEVAPEEVKIGDIIVVKAGEKIPVDGVVIKGEGSLDTSALTGESVPQTVSENSIVLSGSINLSSVLYIRAEKEFYDSTVAKILDMVENASAKKAKAENFITRFARYYARHRYEKRCGLDLVAQSRAYVPCHQLSVRACHQCSDVVFRRYRLRVQKRHTFQGNELSGTYRQGKYIRV